MTDEQGRQYKKVFINEPETFHLTSEKAKALTYFVDKDNLSTNCIV